jgi:hypothetical protein
MWKMEAYAMNAELHDPKVFVIVPDLAVRPGRKAPTLSQSALSRRIQELDEALAAKRPKLTQTSV